MSKRKCRAASTTTAIQTQLDLLFEFCQWALDKFFTPGATHMTLHRGVDALEDHASSSGAATGS